MKRLPKKKTDKNKNDLCVICAGPQWVLGEKPPFGRKCRPCYNAQTLERRDQVKTRAHRVARKIRIMRHYCGGKDPFCACCGVTELKFLAVDHINGGGNKHRKEIKRAAGTTFHCWLVKNKFPDGFQILCHNCNCAKGYYGECPHVEMRRVALIAD